ncbi:MAG TPA: hypothetical protein VLA97_10035 [Nocardioidaceae bacterium]|nr:hypothetical protein [Nocardioidaceae bacterium]
MSVVAVAVVLAALLVLLLRTNQLGLGSALVAVVFGLVLGATPAGPALDQALNQSGTWVWGQVRGL